MTIVDICLIYVVYEPFLFSGKKKGQSDLIWFRRDKAIIIFYFSFLQIVLEPWLISHNLKVLQFHI